MNTTEITTKPGDVTPPSTAELTKTMSKMDAFLEPSNDVLDTKNPEYASIKSKVDRGVMLDDAVNNVADNLALHTMLTSAGDDSEKFKVNVDIPGMRVKLENSDFTPEQKYRYNRAITILDNAYQKGFSVTGSKNGRYWFQSNETGEPVYAANAILEVKELLDKFKDPTGIVEAEERKSSGFTEINEPVTYENIDNSFTASDRWYVAAFGTDLITSLAGLGLKATGVGGFAGAITSGIGGLTAIGMNLRGDYLNPDMDWMDMIKNAGSRLGMEALETVTVLPASLMNGLKYGSTLNKVLVKSLQAGFLAGTISSATHLEFTKTLKKVNDEGFSSLNVDDYRKIAGIAQFAIGFGGSVAMRSKAKKSMVEDIKTTKIPLRARTNAKKELDMPTASKVGKKEFVDIQLDKFKNNISPNKKPISAAPGTSQQRSIQVLREKNKAYTEEAIVQPVKKTVYDETTTTVEGIKLKAKADKGGIDASEVKGVKDSEVALKASNTTYNSDLKAAKTKIKDIKKELGNTKASIAAELKTKLGPGGVASKKGEFRNNTIEAYKNKVTKAQKAAERKIKLQEKNINNANSNKSEAGKIQLENNKKLRSKSTQDKKNIDTKSKTDIINEGKAQKSKVESGITAKKAEIEKTLTEKTTEITAAANTRLVAKREQNKKDFGEVLGDRLDSKANKIAVGKKRAANEAEVEKLKNSSKTAETRITKTQKEIDDLKASPEAANPTKEFKEKLDELEIDLKEAKKRAKSFRGKYIDAAGDKIKSGGAGVSNVTKKLVRKASGASNYLLAPVKLKPATKMIFTTDEFDSTTGRSELSKENAIKTLINKKDITREQGSKMSVQELRLRIKELAEASEVESRKAGGRLIARPIYINESSVRVIKAHDGSQSVDFKPKDNYESLKSVINSINFRKKNPKTPFKPVDYLTPEGKNSEPQFWQTGPITDYNSRVSNDRALLKVKGEVTDENIAKMVKEVARLKDEIASALAAALAASKKADNHRISEEKKQKDKDRLAAELAKIEADKALLAKYEAVINSAKKMEPVKEVNSLEKVLGMIGEIRPSDLVGKNRIHIERPIIEDLISPTLKTESIINKPGTNLELNRAERQPRLDTADAFTNTMAKQSMFNTTLKARQDINNANAEFRYGIAARNLAAKNQQESMDVSAINNNISNRNNLNTQYAMSLSQAKANKETLDNQRYGRIFNSIFDGGKKAVLKAKRFDANKEYNVAASAKLIWNDQYKPLYDKALKEDNLLKQKELKSGFIDKHGYNPDDLDKYMMDTRAAYENV